MDPWDCLFRAAEEDPERARAELEPFWLCDGPHRVERRIPMLPFSREVRLLERLKKELVAYRLVFGQPRQQELLEQIRHSDVSIGELERWMIDLRPLSKSKSE